MLVGRVVEMELAGTKGTHHGVEDTELAGSQGSDHDTTGAQTIRAQTLEPSFLGDINQTASNTSLTTSTGLVDLREQSIRRVGNDGSNDTGDNSGSERDAEVGAAAASLGGLAHAVVDGLSCGTLNSELSHGVWNLLHQDRSEPGIESGNNTHLTGHFRHATNGSRCVGGVGHETDTSSLERAEEDVGDELGAGSGCEVDFVAVFPGGARERIHRVMLLRDY